VTETTHAPLAVSSEEFAILAELLETERAKLLIEIRHTDHRTFRTQLRDRLAIIERLADRCKES
jgi:hypothetical protein